MFAVKAFFPGKDEPIRPLFKPGTWHDRRITSILAFGQLNPSFSNLRLRTVVCTYVRLEDHESQYIMYSFQNKQYLRRLHIYPTLIVFFIATIYIHNDIAPQGSSSREQAHIRDRSHHQRDKDDQLSTELCYTKTRCLPFASLFYILAIPLLAAF